MITQTVIHPDAAGIDLASEVHYVAVPADRDPQPVRVGAEARTTEAMLEYLERLRTSARLSPAVLQTHQVMTEDPHRPIRFTFTASWISAKSAQN